MTVRVNKKAFNFREKLSDLERPSIDKLVTKDENGAYIDTIRGNTKLEKIVASKTDNAVDVFIYDTSKDSDGGAWRKRTNHTTWYNETLNTATRGGRKEFPSVAVIVTESNPNKVTIYDGDDPDLPMWMVFLSGPDSSNERLLRYAANKASAMLNAVLCVATRDTLAYISFIDEYHNLYHTQDEYYFPARTGIVDRNTIIGEPKGPLGNYGLATAATNDVAMTVLANAPIDNCTGLPKPTIAVATDLGLSVIVNSDVVYDITTSDVYDDYSFVDFGDDNRVYYTAEGTQVLYSRKFPNADHNQTAYNTTNPDRVMFPSMDHGGFTNHPVRLLGTNGSTPYVLAKNKAVGSKEITYTPTTWGARPGLTFLDEGETNPGSMVAYATTSYNSGWMYGDIRGAFLSNTFADTITNGNLVSNGDSWSGAQSSQSSTPPTGWIGGNGATWKTESGGDGSYIRLYNENNGGAGPNSYMYQAITTVAGKKYKISLTQYHHATISVYFSVGTSAGGGNLLNRTFTSSSSNTPRYLHDTFTATGTTTYITLGIISGTHNYGVGWDNVTVTEVIDDRAASNNGLHAYGSIFQIPVADGADLVSYSGFNDSNFIRQPYNANLNFGTGDLSIMGWFKLANAGSTGFIVDRASNQTSGGGPRFAVYTEGSQLKWYTFDGASNTEESTSITGFDNVWVHFVCTRLANGNMEMYINGKLQDSRTGTSRDVNNTNSEAVLVIGHRFNVDNGATSSNNFDGSLSLIRIAASIPTAAQVKKIYDDEKNLFLENAKCTLYGSSDLITALAYDDSTDRLHVGTSSGRSDFEGLRRINNTTTAVTNSISAHDGFIVEK